MTQLTTENISDLIGSIYDCSISGEWKALLEKIRKLTLSNKAFFVLWNARHESMVTLELVTNFDYDPNLMEVYQQRFSEDPWHLYSGSLLEGEVSVYSEETPIRDIQHLSIYKDIFVPMQTHHCIGSIVVRDGEHDGYVALNRGPKDSPYQDQDVALLKQITPHLKRAAYIYAQLKQSKNHVNILNSISENTANGILICDNTGRILSLNQSARELLIRSHYFCEDDRKLIITIPYLNSKMGELINASCAENYNTRHLHGALLLEGIEATEDIYLTASPLKDKYIYSFTEKECCLVTLTPEHILNWESLKEEFSLTKRELELLKLIYRKKCLSALSESMKIKINTVRTHIQNIYRKLGVKTQMDLMIKLGQFRGGI
ncbi:LuxR C-terminal-related transcriptional regulator [Agarivorans aestuarii]|uniref:LuxR C-terminal-related transcriptional regulator n=1 Tax=Agarivorans aestuarii TaxID=1563703 RepID=A0ABU7G355_9ALTE|nr:LuxR C-terminal-related transcriptional regulator [Agarivorans aestuarii]MEE1673730.1 LuxR C-terminal-related transcriptional regulator [Agarivorans aestuarii]